MIGGVALFLVQGWIYPAGLIGTVPDRWMRVLHLGVPAVLLVYGAVTLELAHGWLMPRWLIRIGYASYSIYLSHTLLLAAGRRLWFALIPAGHLPDAGIWDGIDNGLALALLAALALLFGAMSYRFIEAPMLAAVRRRLRPQI